MARSYKKPIYKDKGSKKIYWKNIRSTIKNFIRTNKNNLEDSVIPINKEIINDYDYCDYKLYFHKTPENLLFIKQLSRK